MKILVAFVFLLAQLVALGDSTNRVSNLYVNGKIYTKDGSTTNDSTPSTFGASLIRQINASAALSVLGISTNSGANWTVIGSTNSSLNGIAYVNSLVVTGTVAVIPSAITPSGTNITVDFSVGSTRTISLTTNALFSASNLAAGKTAYIRILCDSTTRSLFWPASWIPIGAPAPGAITAGKYAELELRSWGTTDSDVTIKYGEQP